MNVFEIGENDHPRCDEEKGDMKSVSMISLSRKTTKHKSSKLTFSPNAVVSLPVLKNNNLVASSNGRLP